MPLYGGMLRNFEGRGQFVPGITFYDYLFDAIIIRIKLNVLHYLAKYFP
jgi:hypothetical protein